MRAIAFVIMLVLAGCSTPLQAAPPLVEVGGTILSNVPNATAEAPVLVVVAANGGGRLESTRGDVTLRFPQGRLTLITMEGGVRYHVRIDEDCTFNVRTPYGESNGTRVGASGIMDARSPTFEMTFLSPCSGNLTLFLRPPD